MILTSAAAYGEIDVQVYNVCTIISPEHLRQSLENFRPDLVLVMTYLSKLDPSLSELTRFGMVNVHPSLLPKYRGGSPVFYALKNGETQVGVTYHFISEGFDQGAIIRQESIRVSATDCASSVWMKIIKKIIVTLPSVVACRHEWSSLAVEQNELEATTVGFPSLEERSFSSLLTIAENLSLIRACGKSSGARLILEGYEFFVTNAMAPYIQPCGSDSPKNWRIVDNILWFKALDGWLCISDAYINTSRVTSWSFLSDGEKLS
ncbi:formyltransferase family protein [Pseudomonas graminis]|nr:formyltransferase family protein [Pseudomonas graminis]